MWEERHETSAAMLEDSCVDRRAKIWFSDYHTKISDQSEASILISCVIEFNSCVPEVKTNYLK